MSSGRKTGRPDTKRVALLAELRGRIDRGELPPGARLPSQAELRKKFRTGNATVQNTMAILERDGLIRSKGREGTFVRDDPSNLNHYVMLFPDVGGPGAGGLFYQALEESFLTFRNGGSRRRLTVYRELSPHTDVAGFRSAVADVEAHRVAGLIFAFSPHDYQNTPLLDARGLPRVVIMSSPNFKGYPSVYPDLDGFFRESVRHLMDRGCRRIGMLTVPGAGDLLTQFQRACREAGAETRPYWTLFVSHRHSGDSAHAAMALAHLPDDDRPDGLILADDHLVEGATEGLRSMPSRPGRRAFELTALANFPCAPRTRLPLTWVGFDAAQVVETCMHAIDALRRGETVEAMTWIPPRIESDKVGSRDLTRRRGDRGEKA